jgi:hypothetical protein
MVFGPIVIMFHDHLRLVALKALSEDAQVSMFDRTRGNPRDFRGTTAKVLRLPA